MAKKLVRAADLPDDESNKALEEQVANWKPTPEAKSQATTLRIIAMVAWVVAIGWRPSRSSGCSSKLRSPRRC